MRYFTRQELEAEIIRLRTKVKALELQLERQGDMCELLRVQNDYLQELLTSPDEGVHDRDTIPAKPPVLSDGPITRPSSPKAIRVDELMAALEASETSRRERLEDRKLDRCPICDRSDEHSHGIIIEDTDTGEKPN